MTRAEIAAALADLEIAGARAAAALAAELGNADPAALQRLDRAVSAGADLLIRLHLGTGRAELLIEVGGIEHLAVARNPAPAATTN
jgi:hypothetical protein